MTTATTAVAADPGEPAATDELRWLMGLLARRADDGLPVRLRGGPSPAATGPTYCVLPTATRPRVVFSDGLPASVLGGVIGSQDARARLRRRATQLAATPLGRLAIGSTVHLSGRPALLDEHLAEVLGLPHVGIVVRPGNPDRANRKPIVKVVRPDGRQLAYTKVGWNDLTERLVDREAAALADAPADAGGQLRTPDVLCHERWRGLALLTTSPLGPVGPVVDLAADRHAELLAEVAARGDGVASAVLARSGWIDEVNARVAELPARWVPWLARLRDRLLDAHGDVEVPVGTWHGDWTPWNMQVEADAALVWDWERSAGGVPVGLDAFHHAFQVAVLVDDLDVPAGRFRARARAGDVLRHLDGAPTDLLDDAYALEIGLRWAEDAEVPGAGWLRRMLRDLLTSAGLAPPRELAAPAPPARPGAHGTGPDAERRR